MRLVIIMTNDRFIAKLELTISTDRLQDSLWRAVGKGVNCTSCESKECLSYVWSETVVDGRKRGIEWWRQRGRERTVTTSLSAVRAFFVSPTITFHASLWAVPNPPPYSARPHIDTICSWKISIRFTRWRTVATEIKGIVDVFRVSLISRRCQGICPSLAFDSTKEISCWACCRLRRFCLYNLLFLPLSFGERENWRNASTPTITRNRFFADVTSHFVWESEEIALEIYRKCCSHECLYDELPLCNFYDLIISR